MRTLGQPQPPSLQVDVDVPPGSTLKDVLPLIDERLRSWSSEAGLLVSLLYRRVELMKIVTTLERPSPTPYWVEQPVLSAIRELHKPSQALLGRSGCPCCHPAQSPMSLSSPLLTNPLEGQAPRGVYVQLPKSSESRPRSASKNVCWWQGEGDAQQLIEWGGSCFRVTECGELPWGYA